ncbi:MAG: hypothetical protein AAF721_06535 [Myxococcota bacterium]
MGALTDLTFVERTGPNYIQFQATGGNGPYDYASFMHDSGEILSIAPGSCPTMTRSSGAPLFL